ncbi:MAG: mevalonate kinase [Chloroflexi bacterium]|nr:mevalonate kinase [Chloroflexota bacterium]
MHIQATAYGKLILFGEHAVVYGQPAIAVPLTAVSARITVENGPPGSGVQIVLAESDAPSRILVDDQTLDNALAYTAHLVLQHLEYSGAQPDLKLTLHSSIPIGAGFGSGAAVSTALARALSTALERPLDKAALNDIVYTVEELHHGTPSGIDNTVIVYEKPVFFQREEALTTLSIPEPFTLIVAHAGHTTPTHITVGDVGRLFAAEPSRIGTIFEQIGTLSRTARRLIESGSTAALGPLMNENHRLLQALTVSDEILDRLCEVAREAGALGAKLSGGGRGGNLIALVEGNQEEMVRRALLVAGAARAFTSTVG